MIYRCTLAAAILAWSNLMEVNVSKCDMTASNETTCRHVLEIQKHNLATVQIIENKLNIARRWERGSFEWQAVAEKVTMQTCQHCIDVLEGLVVAWMFELTEMNWSQTGMSSASQR